MVYRIEFTEEALEQIKGVPDKYSTKILTKIEALAKNPELRGTRKLDNTDGGRRLRVGDYRVLYKAFRVRLVVLVVRVGPRKDVYRRMQRLFAEKLAE